MYDIHCFIKFILGKDNWAESKIKLALKIAFIHVVIDKRSMLNGSEL